MDQFVSEAGQDRTGGTVIRLIAGAAAGNQPGADILRRHLRGLILEGSLLSGERLPSSRTLAKELHCARGTVETAYGELEAEGLLERQQGRGSFVAAALDRLERGEVKAAPLPETKALFTLSRRGLVAAALAPCPYPLETRAFSGGVPELRAFPWTAWRRILNDCLRQDAIDLAGYSDPRGLFSLRHSLARWLRVTRGIKTSPDCIVILHSSQQGLALCATLLFDRGDRVALEDPGYPGAFAAFSSTALECVPLPVDGDGLVPDRLCQTDRLAAVYLTPSHQNPLGATLSLQRRLDILAWAAKAKAWIIEDDYGGGLSYDHPPIAALAGLDPDGRTIYIGTASKLIFPGLRLAWMVLPEALVEPFATLRTNLDGHSAALMQACLARFIDEGQLARHIRRMTQLYRSRRDGLLGEIEAINAWFGRPLLKPWASNAGLKLAVELTSGGSDVAIAEQARDQRLILSPLSTTSSDPKTRRNGFVLGFSSIDESEIKAAAARLRQILTGPG